MPQIKSMSTRAAGNFYEDAITSTGGLLMVNGDSSGGTADWAAFARGSGNDWSVITENGYTAFAVMTGLTPGETYDARVIIAGQQFNLSFSTPALDTEGTSGKQPIRRSSF